jgi:phage terminase small subunit
MAKKKGKPQSPAPQKLTPRRELFVLEYLKDFNGTQAAIRAGYSERTANEQAARLLAIASVKEAVEKGKAERQERVKVDTDRLELEAERLALSDVRGLIKGGCFIKPEEIPDHLAPAISSIEMVTKQLGHGEVEHVAKVRFWDKPSSIKLLLQLRGKLNEKTLKLEGDVGLRASKEEYEAFADALEDDEMRTLHATVQAMVAKVKARLGAAKKGS